MPFISVSSLVLLFIIPGIGHLSGFVTAVSYALTIVLLIFIYLRDFLRISLETNKKESESLTTTAKQLLRDTAYTILVIATLTFFIIALIVVIALVLEVTSLMFGSLLINAIKIFTALAIAIAYVLTIALSLIKYGRDLVKMFRET